MPNSGNGLERGAEAGSSLLRMLAVIDLFTVDRPQWTVDEIAEVQKLTQSTAYRYVAALCSSGLLAPYGSAQYSLGSRIIELDLKLRQTDPMIGIAEQIAPELLDLVTNGVVSLISLVGDTAISVFQTKKPPELQISFERGRSMGLFSGAAAKVILAHLPRARQMRLFADAPEEAAAAGFGKSWKEFSRKLLEYRRDVAVLTRGEVQAQSWGIAAPVFNPGGDVTSTLALIMPKDSFDAEEAENLKAYVIKAANHVTDRLKALEPKPPSSDAPPNGDQTHESNAHQSPGH